MSTPPLFAHQKESKKLLKRELRTFDTSDPGTGKTRVHIECASSKVLVLCPKSIMRCAWFDDFAKYAPDVNVSIAYANNRDDAFDTKADVYVTNHDAVNWLVKKPESWWKRMGFTEIIVDESGAFKHHTSGRSRALAKIIKRFKIRRLMNGTPNSNGIMDVWHQLFLLDGGKRLGTSYFAFRSAVCVPEQKGKSDKAVQWVEKPNAEAAVTALIKDITIRHKFEECVDIPPNHQYSLGFELDKKHFEIYSELEAESIVKLSKQKTVSAVNGAVLYGKLLQVASGAVYGDRDFDGVGKYNLIDSDRYEMVTDLIEERAHTVCFFLWQHQRDELAKEMKRRKISFAVIDGKTPIKEREEIVKAYQQGFYRNVLAHPKSAAHGLTMTKGTASIWPSPTSNLEWYQQGLRRVYRISQTEKTETIVVVARNTIEERVYQSLLIKDTKMNTLLNYLKR